MSRNNYSTQKLTSKLSSLASLRNNDNASPSYVNKNDSSNLSVCKLQIYVQLVIILNWNLDSC